MKEGIKLAKHKN